MALDKVVDEVVDEVVEDLKKGVAAPALSHEELTAAFIHLCQILGKQLGRPILDELEDVISLSHNRPTDYLL